MSMECPKCSTRAWGARCPECGHALLPDEPAAGLASFELDVRPVPAEANRPLKAVTGVAPRRRVARPPASSIAPLTLERAWDRRVAWGWGLLGVALEAAALRGGAAQLPLRIGLGVVGALLIYAALCFALNKTCLRVEGGRLSVVRGPLPSGGNASIALGELEQVFVRTTHHSRRKYPWMRYWSPREHYLRYHVLADVAGGREVKLVGDFDDVYEARRFERTLEDHIGITDDPMRGS